MNINNSTAQRSCCGCMVCAAICPVSCIDISLDADGYPVAAADDRACTQCGRCGDVCFKFQDHSNAPHPLKSYVAFNKNTKIRMESSSGGVGTVLAQKALEMGYAVVGAELNLTSQRVEHVILRDAADLHRIRGSKYFPSYTQEAFTALKDVDKAVIFGTPCQISALRLAYPNKDFLYVDLKCFGPMGNTTLKKYLAFLNSINASGIRSCNFRGKDISWKMWGPHVEFNDGTIYSQTNFNDPFGRVFNIYGGVHQTCLSCDYFKSASDADIRLEDAWRKMELVTNESWRKGLSQITAHTPKGISFISAIAPHLQLSETTPNIVPAKRLRAKQHLLDLLRDPSLSLPAVADAYNTTRPLKAKIRDKCDYVITRNRALYMIAYKLFHALQRARRSRS